MTKISVNKFENAVKGDFKAETKLDFYGSELIVKHLISFADSIRFINETVKECFNDETGAYMPEVKEYIIKSNLIEYYTNISLPSDLSKRYALIYGCWDVLEDMIVKNISAIQYEEIINAINEKISTIVDADVDNIYLKMNEMADAVNYITNYIEQIFSGVGKDDIQNIAKAIVESGGKVDEQKIVDALLSARSNNDGENITA